MPYKIEDLFKNVCICANEINSARLGSTRRLDLQTNFSFVIYRTSFESFLQFLFCWFRAFVRSVLFHLLIKKNFFSIIKSNFLELQNEFCVIVEFRNPFVLTGTKKLVEKNLCKRIHRHKKKAAE